MTKKSWSHKLSHGDNIVIGKHVILFVATEKRRSKEKEDKKLPLDKTMLLDTAKQRELLAKQKVAPPTARIPVKVGVISFID